MEIYGVGTDILEVSRIKDAYEKNSLFFERVFNDSEILYIKSKKAGMFLTATGIFAVKEAVSKALGTGFSKDLTIKNITVLSNNLGKPYVTVKNFEKYSFQVSISHTNNHAVAFCVCYL